jgi:hypothetical protein
MFTNPIKRLGESLAQAQEQARLQRLRAQQRPSESKPGFDATEEALFVNGDDSKPKHVNDDNTAKSTEESLSVPDSKDTSLPKEVRIRLAKLAKYEDKHPSMTVLYLYSRF